MICVDLAEGEAYVWKDSTMLKVFLVEDEFVIREAIKKTIDWNAAGFELVGEAGDGEKAYQQIVKTEPDILVTDIRMPFMDGLELSRLVRRKFPKIRIVILSGFDDFEYAREAITIGVKEYLLKPVSGAKLLETLHQVGAEIEKDKQQQSYKEIYEAEHAERIKLERQQFVRSVMNGRVQMAEALETGAKLGVHLEAEFYCVVLLQAVDKNGIEGKAGDSRFLDGMNIITDMAEQTPYLELYEQIGGVLCFLIMAQNEAQLEERVNGELARAGSLLAGDKETLFFASVGQPAERISGIHQSYDDASKRFAGRFLCDASRIFSYKDREKDLLSDRESREEAEFSLAGFDLGRIDRSRITFFLRSGNEGEVDDFVDSFFTGSGTGFLDSLMVRQYIVMDMYLATAAFLQSQDIPLEQVENCLGPIKKPEEFSSPEKTVSYVREVLKKALKERNRSSEAGYSSVIAEAKKYIYKHFSEDEISLSAVADAVCVSPNHLSRLFSQETETTFVEFLTGVRMEKARELLLTTQLPSSEIGASVGYADPHYFYYIFKKMQGKTPKEFRQNGG